MRLPHSTYFNAIADSTPTNSLDRPSSCQTTTHRLSYGFKPAEHSVNHATLKATFHLPPSAFLLPRDAPTNRLNRAVGLSLHVRLIHQPFQQWEAVLGADLCQHLH